MAIKISSFEKKTHFHKGMLWAFSGMFFQNNICFSNDAREDWKLIKESNLTLLENSKTDAQSFGLVRSMTLNPLAKKSFTPVIYGDKGVSYTLTAPYTFVLGETIIPWIVTMKFFSSTLTEFMFSFGDFKTKVNAVKIDRAFNELFPIFFASDLALDFLALFMKEAAPTQFEEVLNQISTIGQFLPTETWSGKISCALNINEIQIICLDFFLSKAYPGYKTQIEDLNKINSSIEKLFDKNKEISTDFLSHHKKNLNELFVLELKKKTILKKIQSSFSDFQKAHDINVQKIEKDFNEGSKAILVKHRMIKTSEVSELKNQISDISKNEQGAEKKTETGLLLMDIIKSIKEKKSVNHGYFLDTFLSVKPEVDQFIQNNKFGTSTFEDYEVIVLEDIVLFIENQEKILNEENTIVYITNNYNASAKLDVSFLENFKEIKTIQKKQNLRDIALDVSLDSKIEVPSLVIKSNRSDSTNPQASFKLETKSYKCNLADAEKNYIEIISIVAEGIKAIANSIKE